MLPCEDFPPLRLPLLQASARRPPPFPPFPPPSRVGSHLRIEALLIHIHAAIIKGRAAATTTADAIALLTAAAPFHHGGQHSIGGGSGGPGLWGAGLRGEGGGRAVQMGLDITRAALAGCSP